MSSQWEITREPSGFCACGIFMKLYESRLLLGICCPCQSFGEIKVLRDELNPLERGSWRLFSSCQFTFVESEVLFTDHSKQSDSFVSASFRESFPHLEVILPEGADEHADAYCKHGDSWLGSPCRLPLFWDSNTIAWLKLATDACWSGFDSDLQFQGQDSTLCFRSLSSHPIDGCHDRWRG